MSVAFLHSCGGRGEVVHGPAFPGSDRGRVFMGPTVCVVLRDSCIIDLVHSLAEEM